MKKALRICLLLGALALLAVVAIGYMQGYFGSSLQRISKEHSVNLPSSSSNGRCDGLVSMTSFGDFGASADFVVNLAQIDGILAQIKETKEGVALKDRRLNRDYEVPKEFGQELRYIEGVSKDGNIVTITLYKLDDNSAGVCFRTQWN